MRLVAPILITASLAAASALADPYGPLYVVTDMAPYCASCHSSTSVEQVRDLPPNEAARETIEGKHFRRIKTDPAYRDLSAKDRDALIAAVKWVDAQASVTLKAPVQAKRNSRIDVMVVTRGGAGPVVGVSLVDSTLRYQARPISSSGFKVIGPALILGPDGKPQPQWAERRTRGADMGLNTVLISGIKGDPATKRVDETRTTWILRTPAEPGTYTIAAAFYYGTEKASPLGYIALDGETVDPGRTAGASGRIMFSEPVTIAVK